MPLVGCPCPVCHSSNPKNQRLRSSCLFEVDGKFILVDTSPDLRQQSLKFGIKRIDAVLCTHLHADHVHGIDDVRPFNVHQNITLPIFGHAGHLKKLEERFDYIFNPHNDYPSAIPKLVTRAVSGTFDFDGITIDMIPCFHGPAGMTNNYRIGAIAWLTDLNGIPEASLERLQGLEYLFIDGLRLKPHPTHLCLEESLDLARKIGAKNTYLIHLSHDYDHDVFNKTLPPGIELAYDGLSVISSDPPT